MTSILDPKNTAAPSIFAPSALLRDARRQKGLETIDAPPVCVLDPDGDLVQHLRQSALSRPFKGWPCYHTDLDTFTMADQTVGIIGRVVGAPFAVLVAEELFASGCRHLLSITSAGQITPHSPPQFVVIDRALRDEGTSYHYMPPSEYIDADPHLVATAMEALRPGWNVAVGSTWTTDAPFRETAEAIQAAQPKGVLAVEMEAAALYAFAQASGAKVLCLAHITNTMGQKEQDFEKGEAGGAADSLRVLAAIVKSVSGSKCLISDNQP